MYAFGQCESQHVMHAPDQGTSMQLFCTLLRSVQLELDTVEHCLPVHTLSSLHPFSCHWQAKSSQGFASVTPRILVFLVSALYNVCRCRGCPDNDVTVIAAAIQLLLVAVVATAVDCVQVASQRTN